MCAALPNSDMLDRCSADRAFFSCAPVDIEVELAAAIDPVEGCAVPAYTFIQDLVDRSMQRLDLLRSERAIPLQLQRQLAESDTALFSEPWRRIQFRDADWHNHATSGHLPLRQGKLPA